jgi:hypothetical protein
LDACVYKRDLLVGGTTGGGFETLGGDKTHCFISKTQAYKHKKLTIHALSLLSSVSLYYLPHTIT